MLVPDRDRSRAQIAPDAPGRNAVVGMGATGPRSVSNVMSGITKR